MTPLSVIPELNTSSIKLIYFFIHFIIQNNSSYISQFTMTANASQSLESLEVFAHLKAMILCTPSISSLYMTSCLF